MLAHDGRTNSAGAAVKPFPRRRPKGVPLKMPPNQTPYMPALFASGMRRLNTRHRGLPYAEREEVLQDSLIDLVRVVERGGRVDNPAAFLAVIIDRTAATAATKLKELREHETPIGLTTDLELHQETDDSRSQAYDHSLSQPAQMDTPFFATAFDAGVRALPERLRDVFIAVDVRGLSQDEAALALKVPQRTLSDRLDLARDLMKEALV